MRNHWLRCAYCTRRHPTLAALKECAADYWRRVEDEARRQEQFQSQVDVASDWARDEGFTA